MIPNFMKQWITVISQIYSSHYKALLELHFKKILLPLNVISQDHGLDFTKYETVNAL